MAERKKSKRKITSADLEAAENLRRLWGLRAKPLGLTQEKVGVEYFDGATQGLISQYVNGTISLGPVAVIRFARALQCKPQEIRKDFQYSVVSDDLTPDAIKLAYKWLSLSPRFRKDVERYIDSLIDASSSKSNIVEFSQPQKQPHPK